MVPRPGRSFPGVRHHSSSVAPTHSVPLKYANNYQMQGLNADQLFEMLQAGYVIPLYEREDSEPEQQEPRIVELDDDYDSEKEREKKKAKNKKKYLRQKEKAQAEKIELQPQQPGRNDSVAESLAGMSIQDSTTTNSSHTKGIKTSTEPQPKLSKRQKKTLLKKAKQAQSTPPTSESASTSINGDATSDPRKSTNKAADASSEDSKQDKGKNRDKSNSNGHEKHEDGNDKGEEKEVATEVEMEAVMATVAKRFGQ